MAQCEAISKTPGRPTFGKQCTRRAVTGSTFCTAHGGNTDTKTPEKVSRRLDRTRQVCTAHKKTGEQCKNYALHGTNVCRFHGGATPVVAKKARERFNDLIDPMINIAAGLVRDAEAGKMTHADQMRLVTFLADRTGFGTKAEVSVEVKSWERTLQGIIKTPPVALLDEGGFNPREDFMLALEAPSASRAADADVIVATVEPEPDAHHPTVGRSDPPRHAR